MDAGTKIWALAMLVGLTAGWIDYRTRRIPNWLTVSGALMGIVMQWFAAGPHGVAMALARNVSWLCSACSRWFFYAPWEPATGN